MNDNHLRMYKAKAYFKPFFNCFPLQKNTLCFGQLHKIAIKYSVVCSCNVRKCDKNQQVCKGSSKY